MNRTTQAVLLAAGLALSVTSQAALIDRGGGLIYDDALNITWLNDANYAAAELTPARIAAITTAINAASPAWLGGRTLGPSDFYGDGGMTWWGAMAWADQLVYGDYSDWRLPRMSPGAAPYGASNNGSQAYLYGATGTGYGTASPAGGWGLPTDADGIWSEMGWMYYHNMGNLGSCVPDDADPQGCVLQPLQVGLVDDPSNPNDESLFTNIRVAYWSSTVYAPNPGYAWIFITNHGDQRVDGGGSGRWAWAVRDGDVAAAPEPATLALLALGLAGLGFSRRKQ